ncbi:hypothetical protein [Anabaena subtropica]|uniref:DUF4402 domain-containing protein n=1 Tax=Anabaena subtropica FACHB-260 TaxID=2692884 RepID=A0ABR8CNP6_9NOST|nr:hypothetical protein [Anabaena subtropica]MBD2344524.1 hypothetical protein [Anabaena subtropica FACHB-260]
MNNLMQRQYFLSITTILLALYQICTMGIASANPTCTSTNNGCIVIENELLEISQEDIVPDGRTVNLNGNGVIGETSLSTSNPFLGNTQISKTINNLWQFQIDSENLNNLQVQYTPSQDFLLTQGSSVIRVNIDPLTPIAIGEGSTPDRVIIQGGATFSLDLSEVTRAGIHSGSLQLTVTEF